MQEIELRYNQFNIIDLLTTRWNVQIICFLMYGPKRFSTIVNSLGISGRVLSDKLKELEKQGIVNREIIPEFPVRIMYSLTDTGYSLKSILIEIDNWSGRWGNSCSDINNH
ncbi:winged helix-turn-helix transcriptional regulator [Oceanobacillus salinisoli]|uniref:winged helix-turn-helix transcriptional regulator n=1 Tax=Oceanobacillus salinisoli TaxID=2678611 RepID=UPI002F34F27D